MVIDENELQEIQAIITELKESIRNMTDRLDELECLQEDGVDMPTYKECPNCEGDLEGCYVCDFTGVVRI